MECELVETELLEDDYIFHIKRCDGSVVKVLVPKENSTIGHERTSMELELVFGLNLVTEGHYS